MAERTGYWDGSPDRWAEPAGDDADPTGGRHAFDRDAALTPIFTTLRRSAHLRPVPRGPRPDPVDRFGRDPQTAEIPVVRPLYAVGSAADPGYRPAPFDAYGSPSVPVAPVPPGTSATETTTWWRSPIGFPATRGHGDDLRADLRDDFRDASRYERERYDARIAPSPYGDERRDEPRYDVEYAGYQDGAYGTRHDEAPYDAAYDQARYEDDGAGRFPRAAPDVSPYDSGAYGEHHEGAAWRGPVRHDPRSYGPASDPGWSSPERDDPTPFAGAPVVPVPSPPSIRNFRGPMPYDPMTDTGRHHRRLAPAGW